MPASDANDEFDDCNDLGSSSQEGSSSLEFGFASAQVDSFTWQRLVSSNLPTDVYRDLLIKMECQPELWRDCALAFLEEQALREAFAGISARDFSTPNFDAAKELAPYSTDSEFSSVESANFESCDDPVVETSVELPTQRPARVSGSNRSKSHLTRNFVLPLATAAAGFLLSFGLFAMIEPAGFPSIASNVPGNSADSNAATAPESQLLAGSDGSGTVGNDSVDRELNSIISKLSEEDRQRLLASPSRQKIRPTVPASPPIAVPGDWYSSRHFVFYRTEDNSQIVLPVDSYQYVVAEVQ